MTKLTLQQVSDLLSSAGKIVIPKEELFDDITKMAKAIYPCPRRNARQRTYKQVFNDCSRIAIEYALAKVLDGERNPNEWNPAVLESYRWDVRVGDVYFEVKRHKIGSHWFSYPEDGIRTFRKHAHTLDYIVTAYMEIYEDEYVVEFALIANAKTFFKNFKPSQYPNQDPYYNHKVALRYGECDIINIRECTYKGNNQ